MMIFEEVYQAGYKAQYEAKASNHARGGSFVSARCTVACAPGASLAAAWLTW
jgi:hypothetical protein